MTTGTAVSPALPAAGSSFYLGMRILPKARREAMYAIYAFCRAVDDIADDGGPRPERAAALAEWRRDIDILYRDGTTTALTADLAPHVPAYALPRESFHDVIDGMAMDVEADIQAPDWKVLDLYCDRVASAVGRLSARVFGLSPRDADELAHHLGRALQLTNILRDLDDDAAIDRLYLPSEELRAAGMHDLTPAAVLAHPGLDTACRAVAQRAFAFYDGANVVMARQSRASVKAPRMMEAAYRAVLELTLRRGWRAPRARVRTPKLKLLGALLRYGFP